MMKDFGEDGSEEVMLVKGLGEGSKYRIRGLVISPNTCITDWKWFKWKETHIIMILNSEKCFREAYNEILFMEARGSYHSAE